MSNEQVKELIRQVHRFEFKHIVKTYSMEVPFLNVAFGKHQFQFNTETEYTYAQSCLKKLLL